MKRNLLLLTALFISSIITNAQTWTMQASGFSLTGTYPFGISVVDANTTWAVGRDGSGAVVSIQEYTKTTDGGNSWAAGSVTADTNLEFSSISGTNGNVAYAMMFNNTVGQGGGIYKTNDGGNSWRQLGVGSIYNSASFPDFVYFYDQLHGVAVGDPNGGYFEIYQTADSGATWTRVVTGSIPAPTTGEFGIINDYTVLGDNIWFGTNKGRVYHSIDRGLHWTAATCGPAANTVTTVSFSNDNIGLAISTTTAGATTLYKSTDGGATWNTAAHSGPIYLSEIVNVPGTLSFVSCGASGTGGITRGSSYSLDGGATWTLIDSANGGGTTNGYTTAAFLNATVGYAGGFTQDAITDGIYKWTPGAVNTLGLAPVAEVVEGFSAYPNPSSGWVTLNLKLVNRADVVVHVTDILGNLVFTSTDKNAPVLFNKIIDLHHLAKGIYAVNVICGTQLSTEKIVIE